MTIWQFVGALILFVVGAILFIGTARATGWKDAVVVWAAAMVLAGVIIVGVFLVKGELP